jgi:hypothetical protein
MAISRNPFLDLPDIEQDQTQKMGKLESALTGFNTGVERFAQGGLQGLNSFTRYVTNNRVGNDFKRGLEQTAKEREAEYQRAYDANPGYATGGTIAGGVGATLPLALVPGVGQSMASRAITSAAAQGGLTGAGQWVDDGESRIRNTLVGAVTGGLAGGAGYGIGKGLTKTINTIKGNFADPAEQAVYELGKKYNVPLMADDISQNRLIKGTGRALEEVPFIGTTSDRQAQMLAAEKAARSVTQKAAQEMDQTPFDGLSKIQEVANSNNPIRSKAAKELLEQVANSGDDWNKIIQTSGNLKLFQSKLIADQKYKKVAELADKFGDINTSNISKAVNNIISNESKGVLKNEGLLSTLNKIKEGLTQRSPATNASSVLDEFGMPLIQGQEAQAIPKSLNYSQLKQFRSDLGDEISDYFTGKNAAIGKKGIGALQSLKQQVDNSLNNFAQTNGPELKTLWTDADLFYKNNIVPAKDKLLASALKEASPDEVYSKFITRGTREGGKGTGRAQTFYNALDNKGKAAVRYGMVSDAFEKAYKADTNQFSPAQFAGELDRLKAAKGVFFNDTQKAEINGFKNLMRHAERSFQAINKPETGVKNIPYIIAAITGAGMFWNPTATAGLGAATYGIKKLFTTDAGKRFLLSSSTLKPGTPGMQAAFETLSRTFQQGLVVNNLQNEKVSPPQVQTNSSASIQNPFLSLPDVAR